ncbi:MAG: pentapeptide repeat-containing protein [Cyanobacteriota bacterium]|nr:pentapeptide repeat-containing protein [Cyanobacteriota bacterium]
MKRRIVTIEELLQSYEKGERDFAGIYLYNEDFYDYDYIDLSRINLKGAMFRDFSFFGFSNKVNFTGANLSDTGLEQQMLEGFNFSGANLSNVNLCQSTLDGSNLSKCNLSGANLKSVGLTRSNLHGVNFSRANMESVKLAGIKLTNVNLSGAINLWLDGAIFDNTIMPDGNIRTD